MELQIFSGIAGLFGSLPRSMMRPNAGSAILILGDRWRSDEAEVGGFVNLAFFG